jgi:hypothetical protein
MNGVSSRPSRPRSLIDDKGGGACLDEYSLLEGAEPTRSQTLRYGANKVFRVYSHLPM